MQFVLFISTKKSLFFFIHIVINNTVTDLVGRRLVLIIITSTNKLCLTHFIMFYFIPQNQHTHTHKKPCAIIALKSA